MDDPTLGWLAPGRFGGTRPLSRTEALRHEQAAASHETCFGPAGKARHGGDAARQPGGDRRLETGITPVTCGEHSCPYRRACVGLHLDDRLHRDRVREESIELLSRAYLLAVAVAIEETGTEPTLLQADAIELVRLWTDCAPKVLLLGAFSSGKTTVLAHLLELDWLPVGKTPTTAVPIEFRFGPTATGRLWFRTQVQVTLAAATAQRQDPAALDALTRWLQAPAVFGITEIHELTGDQRTPVRAAALLAELHEPGPSGGPARDSGSPGYGHHDGAPPRRARTFQLSLAPRPAAVFDLGSDPVEFANYLTDPSLALTVRRASCELPHPRLKKLSFLDTPGLNSAIAFHADVTAALLRCRPDKVLVLLDARALGTPQNIAALRELRRFVTVPPDYRHVTVGITMWDLALRNEMDAQDSTGPERDFGSPTEREAAAAELLADQRRELSDLLSAVVGVPPPVDVVIQPLGLGASAPREMQAGPDELHRWLEAGGAGWPDLDVWAARWCAATTLGDRVLAAHQHASDEIRYRAELAADRVDRAVEAERIDRQRAQLQAAIARAEAALASAVESRERVMLAEIAGMRSRKALLAYLETGYQAATRTAVDSLHAASRSQLISITSLYGHTDALLPIALDQQLLGLDETAQSQIQEQLHGAEYTLKRAGDFVFGGVLDAFGQDEWADEHHSTVRELFSNRIRRLAELMSVAVQDWMDQARNVERQALAELAARTGILEASRNDARRLLATLDQRLEILDGLKPVAQQLARDITQHTRGLAAAASRDMAAGPPTAATSTSDIAVAGRRNRARLGGMDWWTVGSTIARRSLEQWRRTHQGPGRGSPAGSDSADTEP